MLYFILSLYNHEKRLILITIEFNIQRFDFICVALK